jgi:hypothetical protein
VAVALLSAIPHAQAQRAVAFNGDTYLKSIGGVNVGGSDPHLSQGGTKLYWYCSSFPTTAAIMSTYPDPRTSQASVQIMHQQLQGALPGTGMRFELYLSAAGQTGDISFQSAFKLYVGQEDLPYDGKCHVIGVVWDTSTNRASYSIDAIPGHWDPKYTRNSSQWFVTANFKPKYASYSRWYIGAAEGFVSRPSNIINLDGSYMIFTGPSWGKYVGTLSEVYFHIGDTDYDNITNPFRTDGPMRLQDYAMLTDLGIAPIELGPNCTSIFGLAGGLPQICMRGPANTFYQNSGLSPPWQVIGTLTTAVSDPFEGWQ